MMSSLPNVKSPCAQCPFRKDALKGWLGSERMTEILSHRSFVCHKKQHLQCAGHMLIKGVSNDFVKLAGRLGINLELSGKELVFDNEQSCINHHANKSR
jgi:hypothetical protein